MRSLSNDIISLSPNLPVDVKNLFEQLLNKYVVFFRSNNKSPFPLNDEPTKNLISSAQQAVNLLAVFIKERAAKILFQFQLCLLLKKRLKDIPQAFDDGLQHYLSAEFFSKPAQDRQNELNDLRLNVDFFGLLKQHRDIAKAFLCASVDNDQSSIGHYFTNRFQQLFFNPREDFVQGREIYQRLQNGQQSAQNLTHNQLRQANFFLDVLLRAQNRPRTNIQLQALPEVDPGLTQLFEQRKLQDRIPDFTCPITGSIIREPVKLSTVDSNGETVWHHFEKSALETHIANMQTQGKTPINPINREPIKAGEPLDAPEFKEQIDELLGIDKQAVPSNHVEINHQSPAADVNAPKSTKNDEEYSEEEATVLLRKIKDKIDNTNWWVFGFFGGGTPISMSISGSNITEKRVPRHAALQWNEINNQILNRNTSKQTLEKVIQIAKDASDKWSLTRVPSTRNYYQQLTSGKESLHQYLQKEKADNESIEKSRSCCWF